MADLESFEELEKIQAEENAGRSSSILTLSKDGDIVTFRLLRDVMPFYHYKEHQFYDENNRANTFRAVCASELGQPCHYCALYAQTGDYHMKAHSAIAYPIKITDWQNPRAGGDGEEFRRSQVGEQKLFLIKTHKKQTQHFTLRSFYTRYKTALSADWILSRQGEKKLATYSLAGYKTDDAPLPTLSGEDVRELLYAAIPARAVEEEVVSTPF